MEVRKPNLAHLERALALAGALALGWFVIAWFDARTYQARGHADLERTLEAVAMSPTSGAEASAPVEESTSAHSADQEAGDRGEREGAVGGTDAPGEGEVSPPGASTRRPESVSETGGEARRGPRPSPAASDSPRPRATAHSGRALAGEPLGLLEVPRLGLSVVVAEGIGGRTLRRAVGHLPETPLPGAPGNAAIAGHRDSHFLPLREILVGDEVRVRTAQGLFRYEVEWVRVVEPTAVEVLDPTDHPALTLITCYPFSHLGSAPDRYVVRARLKG
jgi:sortase A